MGNILDKPLVLDRIKEYYKLKGNAELARFLGVAPNTITNWYGRKTFDIDVIYTKCVDIDMNWLLTGEGNMLRTESKEENIPVAHPSDSPMEGIPLIPISAMAGAFTGEQTVLEYECERFVVPTFKGAEFLISVKGSSMYPKYNSGDIVACKRLPMGDIFFQWNKVYVLDTDQGPLIKRVKPGSDKEHVLIVSDNERYEPFELPLDRIYHVALVIGVIRLE
ncbi:LexA family transcriptional regulator [Phocaeicola barnesiae]|jgi:phage repressor protein C with HTH and peptisase S24 domain|uniref:LexA family transcriptional regulator n=1 Tax=Phocaeicola barnesiae TaxID=376804 RepID=UPI0025A4787B|nr:S24 family peptidase [Phocaeicola barnesiae]MDM8253327.1 S24 family peptidase [Phocaeicola barnesiae]